MADPVETKKALEAGLESFLSKQLPKFREALLEELAAAAPPAGVSSVALSSAFYRIAGGRTQTEIMQSLLDASAGFAGRAAVLVVKSDRLDGWRSRGFDSAAAGRLRELHVAPEGEAGWKQALAVQSAGAAVTEPVPAAVAAVLFGALGAPADNRAYLLALMVKDRPVALLYADGGSPAGVADLPALDLLARITGMCVELLSVRGQRPAVAAAAAATAAPAARPAEPERKPAPAPEPVAVAPIPEPEPVAAPAPPAAPAQAAAPPARPAVAGGPDLTTIPAAEHDSHKKAFRAAKVMVDELLLYNKDKIEAAKAQRNVYGAIKDDIDKSRANYEKRFKNTPAGKVDYFHQQLLQRIAQNDPALLGADYPGPLV
jgi:hypothetical protein